MVEVIKELRKLIKERKEEEQWRCQLLQMPLNFEALEHLANKYKDREIEVDIAGGNKIIIRNKDDTVAPTFRDKFIASRQ